MIALYSSNNRNDNVIVSQYDKIKVQGNGKTKHVKIQLRNKFENENAKSGLKKLANCKATDHVRIYYPSSSNVSLKKWLGAQG